MKKKSRSSKVKSRKNTPKKSSKVVKKSPDKSPNSKKIIDTYDFISDDIPITITVYKTPQEYVPIYEVSISGISRHTEIVLERIRNELTNQVTLGMIDILNIKDPKAIEKKFIEAIAILLKKHFPGVDEKTHNFLKSYLMQRSLGMGPVEVLLDDNTLEEIAINSSRDSVWVYHKKHGWLKTTIIIKSEEEIKRYSAMIGRRVGRQLTMLDPLMDASLPTGDRVNSTIMPISAEGNTITLRKFAAKPWTITDLIRSRTISAEAASLVWLGLQYELSALIAGGTASGKTSMLNSISNFFPPNQRIITIEDTREIRLPKFVHCVPMITRLPNPEGKGEVSMLDLLVNSLRMRPDRILVGEIRRKKEAEVLFEAIHTGHSVYATVHANNAEETITRLTSPPIEIPKTMLPAISMIIVQYRNRRSGVRRTFQISEILDGAEPNILMQLDIKKDTLNKMNKSKSLMNTIQMFTGLSTKEINSSLKKKEEVLKWLVKQNINAVDAVGKVMAEYYTNQDNLMKYVKSNKMFG